jgi:predicted alpha/beta hydrolase family esterase
VTDVAYFHNTRVRFFVTPPEDGRGADSVTSTLVNIDKEDSENVVSNVLAIRSNDRRAILLSRLTLFSLQWPGKLALLFLQTRILRCLY